MDTRSLAVYIIITVTCLLFQAVPGQSEWAPDSVEVEIWEGDVMVHWRTPWEEVPANATYQVQVRRPGSDRYELVESCDSSLTQCDISHLMSNYTSRYWVWVVLLSLQGEELWSKKKPFTMTESRLRSPVLHVEAHTGSVSVEVHSKPELLTVFRYPIKYTISLRQAGQDNKTLLQRVIERDGKCDSELEFKFDELDWGREYCVNVTVEYSSGPTSNYTEYCIYLHPDQFTVATLVLISAFACVAVLIPAGICLFLCRPAKTPNTLKPLETKWSPLSVSPAAVEVVMSHGWFLSRGGGGGSSTSSTSFRSPQTMQEVSEDKRAILEEEQRRVSLDSGVNMVGGSGDGGGGGGGGGGGDDVEGPVEDSGCGSMGSSAESESESNHRGLSVGATLPLEDRRRSNINGHRVARAEDSGLGLGLGFANDSTAGSSDGSDCSSIPDAEIMCAAGDGYRSQSPASVVVEIGNADDAPPMTLTHTLTQTQTAIAPLTQKQTAFAPETHTHTLTQTQTLTQTAIAPLTQKQTAFAPETHFDMAAPMVGYRPSQMALPYGQAPMEPATLQQEEEDLHVPSYLRKAQAMVVEVEVEAPGSVAMPDILSLPLPLPRQCSQTAWTLPQLLMDETGAQGGGGLGTLPLSLGDLELTFG
ncbi:interleukin-10 receptor subunit alpha [Engraulis encrasicolus]|uniref:interleukin-10 receptor subunit alpha n=1 Tax=Engraulis encrasicolus TaxID=184585 RepID=UPI002FD0B97C